MAGCRTSSGAGRWSYPGQIQSQIRLFHSSLFCATPNLTAALGEHTAKFSVIIVHSVTIHQRFHHCKLFTSCLMTIIPCYHICFWSYHTEYVTMSFSLSLPLSLLLSICTAVHSQSHDSILLTYIAEQIVNRFHSDLLACLSIISPRTVSYCICIYLFVKQICSQITGFFFSYREYAGRVGRLVGKETDPCW